MKSWQHKRRMAPRRKGAMLVLAGLMLIIMLVMATFSVDIAYMELTQTQLQTATDAASRAASEALARTQSETEARRAARAAAGRNLVAGAPLRLEDSDIIFGSATPDRRGLFTFRPGDTPLNAVQVNGRRTDNSPSGSVDLFLGGFLGVTEFQPQTLCIAASTVRDIALVLDRSGSMQSEGKIDDLKAGVSIFLDILEATPADERVSLSTYSTTGTKDIDMTSDLEQVRRAVNRLPAEGFTAIGQGMRHGSDSLEFDANSRRFAEKSIVLLTDGIENRGPFVRQVLGEVVARDQVVHTITFGRDADQNLMRLVANQTGGTHRHAPDGAALREAFEEIARTLAVIVIQ